MLRLGPIVRFLMLVVCLVPFTSAQQVEGALAPILPPAPAGEVPCAPGNEENEGDDGEREDTDGKDRHAAQAPHQAPIREQIDTLPAAHVSNRAYSVRVRTTPPAAADPFRNGLGTPYRC